MRRMLRLLALRFDLFCALLRFHLRDPWPEEAERKWRRVEESRAALVKLETTP